MAMNGTIRYTIRPYDTIWMLGQVFNTTVDSIMELNPGINPRNLQIGQVITIMPGYQYYPPFPMNNQDGMSDDMFDDMMNGDMMNGDMMNGGMMNGGMMNGGTTNGGTMNGGMMNGGMMNGGTMNGGMMNGGMMNGGMMNGGMMNGGMMNDDMMNDDMVMDDLDDGVMCDLMAYFRMLWEQHVTWTRAAIVAIIHDLPETELIVQRLLRNPADFANALQAYYGDEAAQTFADLFTEHIVIAAELVRAAKAEDSGAVADAEQRWSANADQIAEFLGSINPNWNTADWNAMFDEHLRLLRNMVVAMLDQNYEESINIYDDVEAQALEMADMMAEGIAIQFPA